MNTPFFLSIKQLASQHQALLFLISLAVLGRLLPHPDNITPLAAIGLFAGAYLDRRLFLLVPVIAAFVSDIAGPGIYSLMVMTFVYAGLLLSSVSGRLILKGKKGKHKFPRLPAAVLASAIGFYLVSNLGPWWAYYEHSLSGLLVCYANGLPYLARSLAGDALYSLIFFGLYESMLAGQKRLAAHA
jgi:hypothetical protein